MNKFLLCALLTTTAFVSASSNNEGRTRSTSRAEAFRAAFVPASSNDAAASRPRSTSRANEFLAAFEKVVPGKGGLNGSSPTGVTDSVFNFDGAHPTKEQTSLGAFDRAALMKRLGMTPASLIGSIASNLQEMGPEDSVFVRAEFLNSGKPEKDNVFNVYLSRLSVGATCDLVPGVRFRIDAEYCGDLERKSLRSGHYPGKVFRVLENSAFSEAGKK